MKPEYLTLNLLKNEAEQRFEMNVDGSMAIIEYSQLQDKIYLVHTEVPQELEGKGAATAIIEKALDYIETNHFKLIPLCPFVLAYIKRHPQWKRIVDDEVKNL